MFKSTRIKLTAWYLLIIMLISLAFSGVIYEMLTFELNRVERTHRLRIEHGFPQSLPPLFLDPSLIAETKNRIRNTLAIVNLGILGASAVAGYFLADRTLRPIQQMLEEQNRFVADASHELRTPLTSLKAEIEVNLRNKKLTLSEAKNLIASNLEEVNRMQELTDKLLILSHYQNGLSTREIINLKETAKKALQKLEPQAKTKKIVFQKVLANALVKGESLSLTELATIILDNAIKYSHSGGQIILTTKEEGKQAILQVQDFGVGIETSQLPHLFNRFYRADVSRSQKVSGYGLGLAIAKNIVDIHQGKITVRSTLGKGSLFEVKLPLFSAVSQV